MQDRSFYIYALKDPRESPPQIFYIGKGIGARARSHLVRADRTTKGARIREIRESGNEPLVEVLVSGLSETAALKIEAELIASFGTLATGGSLTNSVIPSGTRLHHRREVAVPPGSVDKAQAGLALLRDSVYSVVEANPEGVENADVCNALGLHSDHEGKSLNYLSYSLLGLLLSDGAIEKARYGNSSRYRKKQ
ncbi:MAG: GIY-YIG nuclease family protein [Myxococcales bacterium]|nr:GIY-YIG nuclease family protein [Myxococcales bacterium]